MSTTRVYPIYLNEEQISLIQEALSAYNDDPALITRTIRAIANSVDREDERRCANATDNCYEE